MIKFIGKVPCESIIDVTGVINASEIKSELITKKTIELTLKTLHVVSRSKSVLPF